MRALLLRLLNIMSRIKFREDIIQMNTRQHFKSKIPKLINILVLKQTQPRRQSIKAILY